VNNRFSTWLASLGVAVWGAATFAALLASYSAFRPVRDALILDGDPDQIPWLFLGTFVAISIASPIWSALLAKRSPRRSVPVAFHVFAVCAAGFFLVVRAEVAPIAVGRVFYIWSAVFNLFVVSVFWSLLADLLGPGIARKLYGPIAAGGTVGTVIGPLLTKLLVGTIGVAGVLLMSAVLLELAVIGVHQVRRTAVLLEAAAAEAAAAEAAAEATAGTGRPGVATSGTPSDALGGGGAFTGIAHVVRSSYLSTIVGYVLCTSCAATFLYLKQANITHDAIHDRVARTEYLSSIELGMSAVAFVLQTVIARPAIGRFGPGVVLAVLPLVQLAGISVLTVAPSLASLAVVQVISRALTHGVTRPARELLFTVVSRDDKYRAKNAIDTIGYRFGDAASSWLNQGLIAISAAWGVLIGTIPLVAIWLGFAALLGVGFRRRVTKEVP
jgi:AAA family ATP:ADP antiporter